MTENLFYLCIDEQDFTSRVDEQHSGRSCLQRELKVARGAFAFGSVDD